MRSKLFVPASRPELFPKAESSQADALSFDLEDAVEESKKGVARSALASYLLQAKRNPSGKTLIVRVNPVDSAHFPSDLDAIAVDALDIINIPKVESADDLRHVADLLQATEAKRGLGRQIGILANIESPLGLHRASEIAAADSRVVGLQIGYGDLFAPLGITSGEPFATQHVRVAVKLAAAMAGIAAYDGAYVDIANPDGYRRDAQAAYALGYAGKSCIHPSQIVLANEVFRPTDQAIKHALEVITAAELEKDRGVGAFVVNGRLVDGPFIDEAYRLVERARKLGLV
ncbi:HpcH/HpaI aldolase/citrate lyase family protein [Pollutimonas thiosulfatoxidans]|uniref:CoA ester lyase n=1 Tax=Pollutimonas thiosulfatoxidans TaxID=2028345 RepID=A0A410GEE2_9BURK|nr:CoA ester lyase [Pollutimonas thiosulfatoxidans]QAA94663.1 CoA ester lyase [Pollutimonas thiosulfatoxidans]